MLTIEDYKRMFAENRDAMRESKKQALNLVHKLEDIHEHALCTHCNPQKTIDEFVDAVGYEEARYAVATLVNVKAWDGRISPRNAEWARNVADAWDEESGFQIGLYTNRIHTAHVDQLADYMRRKAV